MDYSELFTIYPLFSGFVHNWFQDNNSSFSINLIATSLHFLLAGWPLAILFFLFLILIPGYRE